MEIPEKQLENGFHMPVFGIGTWRMGEGTHPGDDDREIEAIRGALSKGVSHVDTAEIYADGRCEELVGNAIQGFERSNLFIISKVYPTGKSYDDIIASCRASLERVSTEYFDLYLLHRVPDNMEEAMRAMHTLVGEGFIRAVGVANFGPASLRRAQAVSKHPIVYNQVHYNLQFREPEASGLLSYSQESDVLMAAWRPVQKGALLTAPPPIIKEMCEKYQKTPAQIAINWLISQDNVVTLAKTSTIAHVEENLGAVGWKLEERDIERLRREYPNQKNISDSVPLG